MVPPTVCTGSDILKQLEGTSFTYGKYNKSSKKRKMDDVGSSTHNPIHTTDEMYEESSIFEDMSAFIEENIIDEQQMWKKKSILFELVYFEYNLLRHNLNPMHIEKNVCDNILGTLMNLDGKTKDNENTRKDLKEMGIRPDLHLKDIRVPDGYASNISRGVSLKDRKLYVLKSHDGHILMQDILPIALRDSMITRDQYRVNKVISDFCSFFKGICAKVLDLSELERMESQLVQTLCELEKLFPPIFFTIMVHLTVNLVSEAKLGGPVHYRWMYPVERYLMRLKSYVRNRAQPEGSIAEGYIKEECITFCSRYFEGVETLFNRLPRNDENVIGKEMFMLNSGGRKIGKTEIVELDNKSLTQAHRYVLLNHHKIEPFRDRFLAEQEAFRNGHMDLKTREKLFVEEFPSWLQQQVCILEKNECDEEVLYLAMGPNTRAKKYKGFIINGFRFLTKRREEFRRTQNSGFVVDVEGENFYGKLTDIIELDYFCKYKVVLFRCDWVDIRLSRGLKRDRFGSTLVNFSKPLVHTGVALKDDPFIISSQARQVFYVDDLKDGGWSHVIMTMPRDMTWGRT